MDQIKVGVLGEASVGKTSIISQFHKGKFRDDTAPTLSFNFITKELAIKTKNNQNKLVKFEVWDTAGQEKYRSIAKMYYKHAKAVILIYDITRKNTFEEIKNYWINELKQNAEKNIVIALVGNKSDLIHEEQVSEEEAKEFADKNGIHHFHG